MSTSKIKEWQTAMESDIQPGSVIKLDSGRCEPLAICDDWERAQFRFPNPIQEWRWKHAIACNVKVTGRTAHYKTGDFWVRVRVEWVQDDEPSTFSGGWLRMLNVNAVWQPRESINPNSPW